MVGDWAVDLTTQTVSIFTGVLWLHTIARSTSELTEGDSGDVLAEGDLGDVLGEGDFLRVGFPGNLLLRGRV